ncbi:MAG: sulfatase [Bdellovibrionota bacterium]
MKFISLLLLGLIAVTNAHATCLNCNVILISLDTVAAKHLSVYGAKGETTPFLKSWAKKSRLYSNAYTVSPWTLPSHAAMLTGIYPWNLGVFSPEDTLKPKATTLAELLKGAGYKTAAFTGGLYVSQKYGFNQGFDSFQVIGTKDSSEKNFNTNIDLSLKWIHKNKAKPFFLFMHTFDAHAPYMPSKESLKALGGSGNEPVVRTEYLVMESKRPKLDENVVKQARLAYQAGLLDVDKKLNIFFSELQKKGLDQNTIIILTSDHGEELGEHNSVGMHGFQLYDEVLKVPLIVYEPNKPAAVISSPASIVDIVPTVMSLLNRKNKVKFDGIVLPEIEAKSGLQRTVLASTNYIKDHLIKVFDAGMAQILAQAKGESAPKNSVASITKQIQLVHFYSAINNDLKIIIDLDQTTLTAYDKKTDPTEMKPLANYCQNSLCKMQLELFTKSRTLSK